MGKMASQITSLTIVYSTVYSGADQTKHQNSVSLAFVQEIHRWLVNSPHKWPVMQKIFPFYDIIMLKLPELNIQNFSCSNTADQTDKIFTTCLISQLQNQN